MKLDNIIKQSENRKFIIAPSPNTQNLLSKIFLTFPNQSIYLRSSNEWKKEVVEGLKALKAVEVVKAEKG